MGSFVDKITAKGFDVGTPWSEITESIDYARSYAESMRTTLATTIETLENGITAFSPNFGGIDDSIPGVSHPMFPEGPDLTIDLNENWPDPEIPTPSLTDANVDTSYTEPTAPDEISDSIDFTPGSWSGCLLETLCNKVLDDLNNGGTGLSDEVHAAILARNREARRLDEDRARRNLNAALSETGIDIPSGQATAAILELEEDILKHNEDADNAALIQDFELADKNSQVSKELALKIDEFRRKAFDSDENRRLEVEKTVKDYILNVYREKVRTYLAKWEGVKAKLEAAKLQVEAIISENESKIKIYLGQADVLRAQYEAISKENSAKADVARARATIYESEVRAYESKYRAFIEEVRIEVEKYRASIEEVMRREQIRLEAFKAEADLRERATESIASIASQGVASALGATHMSMSYGYQGATSVRQSQSISNSLSESHSYQEE